MNERSTPRTDSRPPPPRSSPNAAGTANTSAGRIRDLEAHWTRDETQRISTENTTLKQRLQQQSADNRTLDERLQAARSNLRFQDRRIADLEAQLAPPEHIAARSGGQDRHDDTPNPQ